MAKRVELTRKMRGALAEAFAKNGSVDADGATVEALRRGGWLDPVGTRMTPLGKVVAAEALAAAKEAKRRDETERAYDAHRRSGGADV
jgi:hypothetical protein